MANSVVEGVGDGLVREEEGDIEVLLGYGAEAVDNGKGVDDGKDVCLNLEVVLSNMDGDDKVRSS